VQGKTQASQSQLPLRLGQTFTSASNVQNRSGKTKDSIQHIHVINGVTAYILGRMQQEFNHL